MDTLFVALRVLLSLAAVVGLLWFLQRRITKGTRSTRATKLVNVVTRQGLAQKASVVVIDVEGKRFLLGVTEHSVTVLDANELPVLDTAAAFESALNDVESTPSARKPVATPIPFPQQFDPRTGMPRRAGALDGSILSLATWKRAAVALRSSR
ncbi:flagellar biosynthetic protein FliO [Frigoribacterium sp. UYMn621]|jgi:flagellar protein FliO/FliZ|uniref:FliO/MopB family protein n=1 Tax=Frigoribacterium sp. UYMn621 TaxID=3156343 RepID=UPI003398A4E6